MIITMSVLTHWADISQRDIFIPTAYCAQGDFEALYVPVESKMLVLLNAGAKTLSVGFSFPMPGHATLCNRLMHLDAGCLDV